MARRSTRKSNAKVAPKSQKIAKNTKKIVEAKSEEEETHHYTFSEWKDFCTSFGSSEVRLIDYSEV